MQLLSKYDGIPTTKESAKRQWNMFNREYNNHSFWCLSSWHNKCYLVQKVIASGVYKGLVGVYHYTRKPKGEYINIAQF
jgi:hypothetical protein